MVNNKDPRLRTMQERKDPRLRSAQQRVAEIRARKAQQQTKLVYEKHLLNEANKLDSELSNIKSGDINDITKFYNSIPANIRARMKFELNTLKNKQTDIENILKTKIAKAWKDADFETNRGNKVGRNGYREMARAYNEILMRVQKGELLDMKAVDTYAQQREHDARALRREADVLQKKQERAREQQKQATLQTGKVTKINYSKSYAIVNGQKINLSKTQLKNISLSSVRKANAERELKQIATKVSQGKTLSVADFEKARSLGVSSTELQKFVSDTVQYKKNLKLVQQQTKDQRLNFEKRLGGMSKVLTAQQKEILYKSQFVSTTPFLQLPNKIKTKLTALDKMNLSPLVREKLKREVMGQTVNDLGEQLDLFGKSYSQREFEAKLNKAIEKAISDKLKKVALSPEQKFLTGQTLTPKEQQLAFASIRMKGEALTAEQVRLGKKVISSPVTYGENLAVRFQRGEAHPLYNDVRAFSTGVGKGLYSMFVQPVASAFDYGRSLVKRAQFKKTSAFEILKKDIELITKGTKSTYKFVKENPVTAAIIVNTAIAQGLDSSKKDFVKNPAETLGLAMAYLFPGSIIKGGVKALKVAGKVGGASKLINVKKYSTNTFKASTKYGVDKQGRPTVFTKINGVIKSESIFGKKVKTTYNLKYNENTKELGGQVFYNIDGKLHQQRIRYMDEGAYYYDLINKQKVSKSVLPITEKRVQVQITKTIPKQQTIELTNKGDFIKSTDTIEKQVLSIVNGVSKKSTRLSEVVSKQLIKDKAKVIKATIQQVSKILEKKRVGKFKPLTQNQLNQIENFLVFVNYDKKLYFGRDKRTRLAKALGITKTSPSIKTIEKITNESGKIIGEVRRQLLIKVKGEVTEKLKLPQVKFPKKRMALRKNKKGQLNLSQNKIEYDVVKAGRRTRETIDIPKLIAPLPTSKLKLKGLGIYGRVVRVSETLKALDKIFSQKQPFSQAKVAKLGQHLTKLIKEINTILKTQKQPRIQTKVQKQPQIQRKTVKQTQKVKRTPKLPIAKPVPRVTPPRVPKPLKTPRPKEIPNITPPTFGNKHVPREVLVYEGRYRERVNRNLPAHPKKNPIKVKTLRVRDTANRAYKRIADIADKRAVRSVDVKVVGRTGQIVKDILTPGVLKKFTIKKPSSKVLRLVEKSRHAMDNPAERRDVSRKHGIKKR